MSFGAAASTYDTDFSHRRLGRWLRDAVQERIAALFASGDHVLELGCGTGEDALWLAQRGVRVSATDASVEMLAITRHKVKACGMSELVQCTPLDLDLIECDDRQRGLHPLYDGCFSNFGPLNCLADRRPLARALAGCVRPGGYVALVLMAPLCAWEIGWHLLRGDARRAFRRLRRGAEGHAGGGRAVRVWYPAPHTLRAEFAPWFNAVETRAVGALLPPSYLAPLVERWPRLFATLALLDRKLPARAPWPIIADHYLVVLERSAEN